MIEIIHAGKGGNLGVTDFLEVSLSILQHLNIYRGSCIHVNTEALFWSRTADQRAKEADTADNPCGRGELPTQPERRAALPDRLGGACGPLQGCERVPLLR